MWTHKKKEEEKRRKKKEERNCWPFQGHLFYPTLVVSHFTDFSGYVLFLISSYAIHNYNRTSLEQSNWDHQNSSFLAKKNLLEQVKICESDFESHSDSSFFSE